MFTPTRDQARSFLFETWAKYSRAEALEGLEQTALRVLIMHPEYHTMLAQPQRHIDQDFRPDSGRLNPFLHLSLHLAVAEQLAIDQPPGIRMRFTQLAQRLDDEHEALHVILDCLGETIWEAQRTGTPLDQNSYMDCLQRHSEPSTR
jgi:hypothetical protein